MSGSRATARDQTFQLTGQRLHTLPLGEPRHPALHGESRVVGGLGEAVAFGTDAGQIDDGLMSGAPSIR